MHAELFKKAHNQPRPVIYDLIGDVVAFHLLATRDPYAAIISLLSAISALATSHDIPLAAIEEELRDTFEKLEKVKKQQQEARN